ncbi:MAG: PAS domain S-box protein [Vicinamibacterales bacterium]
MNLPPALAPHLMGPFVLGHVVFVGFFLCSALYASWTWWLSRRQRVLLLFAAQCLLCAMMSAAFAVLGTAADIQTAISALNVRMASGLLAMIVTAVMASRLTGLRARGYLWTICTFLALTCVLLLLPRPGRGELLMLRTLTLPWGESLTTTTFSRTPIWLTPIYAAVASVDIFAIVGAVYLFRRDRTGGVLVGICGVTGLTSTMLGVLSDHRVIASPYVGDFPFACWVVLIATQLSRENARTRRLHRENDQRLRAIFDHTLHFMGLLDVTGTVLEVNRPVLDAMSLPAAAFVGRPFWETPIWSHSPAYQARVQEACRRAADGQTVRFETEHPLSNGGTGWIDFSLKPILDAGGAVIYLVPEGRDITDRKKTQAALDRLVSVIGPQTGQDFFQTAVDALCAICEAEWALVGAIDPLVHNSIRTIAVSRSGRKAQNFTYDLDGTPCATVVGRDFCYYPRDVQSLFPNDQMLTELDIHCYMGLPIASNDGAPLGLIAVLHREPLAHAEQARALLQVVSARAGAELERRRVDAALIESESRFRTLVEDIEVGVVLHDKDDRILLSNPAAARVLGLTREQLHGVTSAAPDWELVREDGTPCPPDEVPSVLAARTGQTVRNVILGVRNPQQNARRWLQITAAPRLRTDGALLHVLVTMVDVTDRKRAEEAVRASSRRLSLAISATSDAVWEWNYQTGETYYSPRWYEMLGISPGGPTTLEMFRAICHPDDVGPTMELIEAMVNRPDAPGWMVEFRMRRGDGSWIWILGRGNVVERDRHGRPLMVAGTNADITQRKEAEARRRELEGRLAQSHRMESMGRLAGGIAHDFNNILTVINGYSDLLLGSLELDAASTEMLTDIRNAGERAAALTRQLLTFSRHQVTAPDTHELNIVVADTERMLQRLIGEHIALRTHLCSEFLWVRADAGQLSQVIVNLAVNARDAMADGGTLTVSTALVELDRPQATAIGPDARPGRYAVLTVSDTGTGIPAELRELVFEPFFTTKGPGRGTGLGLTTVHSIVKQCDGVLTIASEPGTGTTFSIYLPSVPEPGTPTTFPVERTPVARERKTVLMVEDEAAVRHVVQLMLERMGMHVLAALDAQDALRVIQTYPETIDLLLTDVIMPGLNGRQLAERVRATRPEIRTVYMSGYTDDAVVQQVVRHADALYLQKPFDAEALSRTIRQAFESVPPEARN